MLNNSAGALLLSHGILPLHESERLLPEIDCSDDVEMMSSLNRLPLLSFLLRKYHTSYFYLFRRDFVNQLPVQVEILDLVRVVCQFFLLVAYNFYRAIF